MQSTIDAIKSAHAFTMSAIHEAICSIDDDSDFKAIYKRLQDAGNGLLEAEVQAVRLSRTDAESEKTIDVHIHMHVTEVAADDGYIDVAETTLPSGQVVPAFRVAQYPAGQGPNDLPISTPEARPWVNISYHDVQRVTKAAGLPQWKASQCAAIAYQIINQDENWTGGKVGEGHVYKGIHAGEVSGAQPGNYEPTGRDERTWHVLANGERIYHFSGNVFQWMFDDLHGDEQGLVGPSGLPADSPLLTIPTAPSMEKGMGYRPDGARTGWSGGALVRGGYWLSGSCAGVFYLGVDWPVLEYGRVGFRCTKPLGH